MLLKPVELVERDGERELIAASLGRASAGTGSILVFEGPAGIGKSRLLAEAAALGAGSGAAVRTARASVLEREYAFGVARQLLGGALAAAAPPTRERLLAGSAAIAERVLEDAGVELFSAPTGDASFAALHGLYWLLSNLTEDGPQLLVVDDLQWADEASIRLLSFLAPRLDDLPVAIVAALRSGDPDAGRPLLEALLIEPAAATRELDPLSDAALGPLLATWLGYDPGPDVTRAALASVAGNPLLLRLLAADLRERAADAGSLAAEQAGSAGPSSVSRTIRVRIEHLGPDAWALARALSVLGDGPEAGVLASLAGLDPLTVSTTIDALGDADIVDPAGPAFVHPVVGNAIYEAIAPGERARMHAHAAVALREAGAPAERTASHHLLSEPGGDPGTIDGLREAARVAMERGAPAAAVAYLERALRERMEDADRARLLLALGSAQARAGMDEATASLRLAFELAPDPGVRLLATVELGQALAYAGSIEEAVVAMRQALASLDPGAEDHRRVVEMMLLVLAETDTVGREGAGDLLARADQAVARLGDDAPRGLAACVAVERALVDGTADDAARLAGAALRDERIRVEQGPEAPHACAAAAILALTGRDEAADGSLERLMDAAAARGSGRAWAFAAAIRAWARSRRGALAEAAVDARACRALSSGPVWELFEPMALSAEIEIALWRGEAAAARGLLAEATVGAPRPGTIFHQPLRESIGNLLLAEGDPGGALASFEACADWERRWGAVTGMWVDWRPGAVAALLRLGREEEATRLAEEQLRLARAFGAPRQLAEALRSRAAAAGLSGEERLGFLREALDACRSGPRLTRARVLVDLGAATRRERQPRAARQPLAEGLRLARECTATVLADRATAELEASGARPHARQAEGDANGLSPRERQVAEKAVAGLSNPEIGQALFITRKTVETHMRSIFRKLGVARRDQIAAALAASPSRPDEGSGWLTDGR